ncbi:hypothetical protein HPB48_019694 [Haemaphysalis longicornis]|uniref:CCHC-type domain-containing protein n=1 Tax=Haemaphysalis longicornis TaxID=44386 RepID=A0A9J6G364_HAELO|nr:hypothetical protein HPB48_019694 [Haemaphysalis longicornis]
MLQPPDPGDGEMDQSRHPDETATPPETPNNPLYEWHTVVNGKYIPVSKLNTSNAGAVMRRTQVIIRPRNGLQLNAIGTVALARALSKTVQAPKEISSAWTVIIEPNQNIGITTQLKGVIHQIPQGTTEDELRDQIRADGYNVIQARMLGRSTSAVITFEGKTLPHHICYWGAYVRCYPYRRSTLLCHVCRKMGHRADVCPNSSEGACGEHSTGSKACNQRYRPPVKLKQTTDDKASTTGTRKTGLETETGQRHRSSTTRDGPGWRQRTASRIQTKIPVRNQARPEGGPRAAIIIEEPWSEGTVLAPTTTSSAERFATAATGALETGALDFGAPTTALR